MACRYIDLIKDMYDGAIAIGRTTSRKSSEFSITIGLVQSAYLFALDMDDLTG